MDIELVVAGRLLIAPGILRAGAPMAPRVRLPIPVYVIRAGAERILVDTGPHPGAVADARAHYGRPGALGPFGLEQDHSLAEAVDLTAITRVVITHLHFDHAGGLALLPPGVPVVVQRREWEAGRAVAAIARNAYLPQDYDGVADRVQLVDGDHDLFGDGRVRLLLTPGHTPGHQSVCVAGRIVIGGDVAPFAPALDDHRFPVFGDDLEAQAVSAQRLRALRDGGATVLPGHDPDVLAAGPVAIPDGPGDVPMARTT